MSDPERFMGMTPVYDGLADDEPALAEIAREVLPGEWRAAVELAGGTPVGEPEITREPNLRYGMARRDENGDLVRDEDGNPIVDQVRLYFVARGWAVRTADVQ